MFFVDGFESLKECMKELLKLIHIELIKTAINVVDQSLFSIVEMFSKHEPLAEIFLEYSTPSSVNENGILYGNTLLGSLFNISVLPKSATGQYTFFTNPLDAVSHY